MNKKGGAHIILPTVFAAGHALAVTAWLGWTLTAAIVLPAAWHVPGWTEAKKNHTEATYQMQKMWPQEFFGTQNKMPSNAMGNGGNFSQGNSGPIAE